MADGTVVANELSQTFVLATTNFLSSGGDGYLVLVDQGAATFGLLTDAIGDYITSQGLVTRFFDCRMCTKTRPDPRPSVSTTLARRRSDTFIRSESESVSRSPGCRGESV